jgi:hypothetical protein
MPLVMRQAPVLETLSYGWPKQAADYLTAASSWDAEQIGHSCISYLLETVILHPF